MRQVRIFWAVLTVLVQIGTAASALDLTLPGGAKQTGEVLTDPGSYMVPVAPFANGQLPVVEVEGRVLQRAWRVQQVGVSTLQMIRPLRDNLDAAGYDALLDCSGQECGGFDFRFNTPVMQAPAMHIDLFDFRFLSAQKRAAGADVVDSFVSVFISQSGGAGYIQIIEVTPDGRSSSVRVTPGSETGTGTVSETPTGNTSLVTSLTTSGHVILQDLEFGTGSAQLGAGDFASLEALAQFLLEDSDRRLALVGHTDFVGSFKDNVALSRKRARSVLNRLTKQYNVPRSQLEAHGVGYLSPLAPNHSVTGREANRRVEAVLLGKN